MSIYVKTKEGAPVQGPFTLAQVKAFAAGGKLKPHHLISKDGRQWYLLKNVKGLDVAPAAAAAVPVAEVVAEPPPVAEVVAGPPPVAEVVAEPPPVAKPAPARRPVPVAQVVAAPPPVAEVVAEPPPIAEVVAGPPPVAEVVAEPPPVAEVVAGPPPVAEIVAAPPPVAKPAPARRPVPVAKVVAAPPPVAEVVAEPPPVAEVVAEPPPVAEVVAGPPAPPEAQARSAVAGLSPRLVRGLLIGLGGALVVAIAVIVYLAFFRGGPSDAGPGRTVAVAPAGPTAPGPAGPTAPGPAAPTPTNPTAAEPTPSEPASAEPAQDPAVAAPAPPPPGPPSRREPPAPARSLQVAGVAYGGQELQATGSRLTFQLTNKTGKPIKALKGEVRLYDPSGGYLVGLPVEVTDPMAAGATVATDGTWLTVTGSMLSLLRQSSKEMAFKFVAREVAYGDGTSETFQAK